MPSSSLEKFEIELDNPTSIFTPGSIITGNLILDLSNDKTIRAVKLRFKGKCKVQWTKENEKNTITYVGKEQYFRSDMILRGSKSGESEELKAGHYNFPFSFSLPHSIPNSFEHEIGFVRYSIKAIVDRPSKLDYESKIKFTVNSPIILGPETLAGIEDGAEANYCCLFPWISEGSMNFIFRLPKCGYVCGEPVEATIMIQNRSENVRVSGINLSLKQKIRFHSKNPAKTRTESKTVQRAEKRGPFPENEEVTIGLQIPPLPHLRLQHCGLINIIYKVGIHVNVTGYHCDTTKKYEIIMGNLPPILFESQNTALSPNYPTAPMFDGTDQSSVVPTLQQLPVPPYPGPSNNPPYPTNPQMDVIQPAPPGIGFVMPTPSAPVEPYPDHLPPSYESVMANDSKK